MADYDVIVIGAGPGGYVAAIRCAQLGLKTACVDKWVDAEGKSRLGGTCLNVGCIPSKALLDSSHHYFSLRNEFAEHGIRVKNVSFDLSLMMQRKQEIVTKLTGGVEMLFLKNRVNWIKGHARLLSNTVVEVTGLGEDATREEFSTQHIIIATGSQPADSNIVTVDGEYVVDSSGALSFTEVPKSLCVLGAGVIGLELGSVWSRLGTQVTVLNRSEHFLRHADRQIANAALAELQSQGLDIKLNARLLSVEITDAQVKTVFKDEQGEHTLLSDKFLLATGRQPNSEHLNAQEAGLHINQRGFIEVDDLCRTNLQGVYAIGDVVRGPMLAHKASEEGIAVAERIAGHACELNFNNVPWVVYTAPEIAWVGKTEEQLQDKGIEYNKGVFPLMASGRALAMGQTQGLVKVLSDKATDQLLGVHIFSANASEIIAEAVLAMEYSASAEDLARTIHAHPTLSEALHEAAMMAHDKAIHL